MFILDPDQEYINLIYSETLLFPCYIFFNKSSRPCYSTSNGYRNIIKMRQRSMTLLQYYGENEKKLTWLTNKCHTSRQRHKYSEMTLCLYSFLGFNAPCLKCFSPNDKLSTLALEQEVESNHERYIFAVSFAISQEDKDCKPSARAQGRQLVRYDHKNYPQPSNAKNTYFNRQHKAHAQHKNIDTPKPMELDLHYLRYCCLPRHRHTETEGTSERTGVVKKKNIFC